MCVVACHPVNSTLNLHVTAFFTDSVNSIPSGIKVRHVVQFSALLSLFSLLLTQQLNKKSMKLIL